MKRSLLCLFLLCLAGSCDTGDSARQTPRERALPSADPEESEAEVCRKRINAIEALPNLGGAPLFEAQRGQILATVPAEPVLFIRPPEPSPIDRSDAERYR